MKPLKFYNLYEKQGRHRELFTLSAYPGTSFFNEKIFQIKGKEYRQFDPERSKLAAAIFKKISQIGFKEECKVLYLGASHGYTPSFVSDLIGKKGTIFAIDNAPRVLRDLYFMSEKRKNIIPILGDCNQPEEYMPLILGCDILYQDIAQKNQVEIFFKNLIFLKKGGFGLLAIKARSIDVTQNPKFIFKDVRKKLEKHITIVDYRELDPYEKDHCFFVIKKK